jgi:type IV secretory pathway VirB3-like protein
MVCSFVLGLVVGLAVYLVWISHEVNLQPASNAMVLVVCPPFILSYAIGSAPDSAFAAVLGVATIVLANGFLYAGVAAGMYAVVTMLARREKND